MRKQLRAGAEPQAKAFHFIPTLLFGRELWVETERTRRYLSRAHSSTNSPLRKPHFNPKDPDCYLKLIQTTDTHKYQSSYELFSDLLPDLGSFPDQYRSFVLIYSIVFCVVLLTDEWKTTSLVEVIRLQIQTAWLSILQPFRWSKDVEGDC